MTIALIALGGNLGDREATLRSAIEMLDGQEGISVICGSAIYETPPWGPIPQDAYLNACCRIDTSLEPEALLDRLLEIERAHGRERRERWGPRTLDLDILTYGDIALQTDRLSLPHPRMHDRAFVLAPLADIAPDLVIDGETVEKRLAGLDTREITRVPVPALTALEKAAG